VYGTAVYTRDTHTVHCTAVVSRHFLFQWSVDTGRSLWRVGLGVPRVCLACAARRRGARCVPPAPLMRNGKIITPGIFYSQELKGEYPDDAFHASVQEGSAAGAVAPTPNAQLKCEVDK
jgi:hypothetical protein